MAAEEELETEIVVPASGPARVRTRSAAIRARADRLAQRAEAERARHNSLDAAFEMVDRDAEVAGGMIAGALAYRLFIWLLPAALVAIAGLGISADAASQSPQEQAETLGFTSLITNSIASAANSPHRWYALVVGIPILVWATRGLLRILIGAHRLVWADVRSAAPRPTVVATLRLLALLVGFIVASAIASVVRGWSGGFGVMTTVILALPYAAIWLLVVDRLPHRGAPWWALIPGALLFGLGLELMHAVVAYVITPMALAKQGTYGALGLAAELLLALFLVSRLIVAAAVLNATLWARRAVSRSAVPQQEL